jgi:hypothetical protein
MNTKSMFSKPRPKGWLTPNKTETVKATPKKIVVRCSTTERTQREALPTYAGPVRGSGYLLAPCVVLAATVIGTRRAYFTAKEILPAARATDYWRYL